MSDLYSLDQRGPRDDRPKLTLHHIIIVGFALIFGGSKAWLSYKGLSTAPTTLDWLYGVLFFLL
jgi:polyferredoxin